MENSSDYLSFTVSVLVFLIKNNDHFIVYTYCILFIDALRRPAADNNLPNNVGQHERVISVKVEFPYLQNYFP